jgi:hypothetical protein
MEQWTTRRKRPSHTNRATQGPPPVDVGWEAMWSFDKFAPGTMMPENRLYTMAVVIGFSLGQVNDQ